MLFKYIYMGVLTVFSLIFLAEEAVKDAAAILNANFSNSPYYSFIGGFAKIIQKNLKRYLHCSRIPLAINRNIKGCFRAVIKKFPC